MIATTTVTLNEVDLEVEFEYTKFIPAKISGPPEDCYPAEGGDIDIIQVSIEGWDVTQLLSDKVNSEIIEEIRNKAEDICVEEPDYDEDKDD